MEFMRFTAKTVEEAITEASIALETSSDNIEYRVIEKETSGFLGIGRKPAVIEARKKDIPDLDLEFEEIRKETVKKEEPVRREQRPKNERKNEPRQPKPERGKRPEKAVKPVRETKPEKEAAPVKDTGKNASVKELNVEVDKAVEAPVKEQPKKAPANKEEVIARVKGFLTETFQAMGMEVKIDAVFEDDETLNVDLTGPEMGVLIGKRGRTLDSLQYLTSLVANKGNFAYIRVKVDTEDYRRRRKETLENLARNVASKVRRTRKTVFLEPMNPYERRIIHSALQNNPYVSTHSEGEEPYRKVVVTLKKQ